MNRRDFVAQGSAFMGLVRDGTNSFIRDTLSNTGSLYPAAKPRFESITEHVGLYRDVVNVGVVRSGTKTLLIDSGEASILDATDLRLGSIDRVLYTHYHRDQCSGAPRFNGVSVYVPASEAPLFTKATEFWQSADVILDHRYTFRPEIMVLRESVAIDRELRDGEVIHWEGIAIRVVATPGHTDGSLSYFVEVDGKTIAFTGDLIYSPCQIWEFYSLQKRFPGMDDDYWGVGGASLGLLDSIKLVLAHKPTILVPSHGEVIHNPENALTLLHDQLDQVMRSYLTLSPWRVSKRNGVQIFKEDAPSPFDVPMYPPLKPVDLPKWLHRTVATSSYLVAEDKSIFLFDCGFNPIIDALNGLVESGEISGVDAIWASHYHDDHISSVNTVRRKYGSKVYVQSEMQDIFENPTAYCMPCLFPESIHVDHVLAEGERLHWKGYELTAYYFPGQTLYHAGLLIEHDGTRVFMTGDAFGNWAIGDVCSYNRNFIGKDGEMNGIERCLRLLLELKPDLLYAAHWGPIRFSEEYIERTLDLLRNRHLMLTALLPWDDANFGLDPYWVRAYPYRQSILPGQKVTLEARVYNHSDKARNTSAALRAPHGWQVARSGTATIPAHTEGAIRLAAIAPMHPPMQRQVLGLKVHFGERNLGEVAEAIVDYLHPDTQRKPFTA
jgi:glyoxylase-like metal-dependent hydrolase (beta-lactamase superfamily II)